MSESHETQPAEAIKAVEENKERREFIGSLGKWSKASALALVGGAAWLSTTGRSRAGWLEAVGEDGQLQADYLRGGVLLRCGADEERFAVSAAVPTLPVVLSDWLASIRHRTAPPVTVRDGLATLRMVAACYDSAAAEREVGVAGS